MTQDGELDGLVRQRIRGLRVARGWSLDDLAARCFLSPSTLSRIETGHRRIALDQLAPIARALGTTLDQLVESDADDDVVIRPHRDETRGITTWLLAREGAPHGVTSNCVNPGYVRTPLVENQIEAQAQAHHLPASEVVERVLLDRTPVKRLIEPAEVAALVRWLASDPGGSLTGASVPLDGAWTAN